MSYITRSADRSSIHMHITPVRTYLHKKLVKKIEFMVKIKNLHGDKVILDLLDQSSDMNFHQW